MSARPGMPRLRGLLLLALCLSASLGGLALPRRATGDEPPATTLPAGFRESVVFSGLVVPTVIRFAGDGRVFVAEKSGVIKVFVGLTATTPQVVADLRTRVMSYGDRGLLSIALDPNFPATPDLYALYSYDAPPGGTAPYWNDACPDAAATTTSGCVVSGRLTRLRLDANGIARSEEVLVEGWCQQFSSHSVGDLAFGPDGALYVSAGEGGGFQGIDVGQLGDPPNPCGDPPLEGGALRAQDARTTGDPLGYSGAVLRVDPRNPADRRLVAYGFRNPFRIAMRPNTKELWVGSVGEDAWESVNRLRDPSNGPPLNFGWPCYEGFANQEAYAAANIPICQQLYAEPGAVTPPYFAYRHFQPAVAGDGCPVTDSSITGLAFYAGGSYPAAFNGALFFGDFARGCIWMLPPGGDGNPNPAAASVFAAGAATPVDLEIGPGGDLFYVDILGGAVRRIRYQAPSAAIAADRSGGLAPLAVALDGSGSTAPAGETLSYAWDLDGDGTFGDATTPTARRTYPAGTYTVGLRVTTGRGVADTTTITIRSGTPPTASILAPQATRTWRVGSVIPFAGAAKDGSGRALPASAYTWSLTIAHCPSGPVCHVHLLQTFNGVARGSFTAPDHDYPAHLALRLTVRDGSGLTATQSVTLQPETTTIRVLADLPKAVVRVNLSAGTAPFIRTVIFGSTVSLGAPDPSSRVLFSGWTVDGQSEGWAQLLTLTANGPRTVVANYLARPEYSDVLPGSWAYADVGQLAARQITLSSEDGRFDPDDTLQRAQLAALIARATGWDGEDWDNPFPEPGAVDDDLWRAVGTLYHYGVARGYANGRFNPAAPVLAIQAVSLVTRAMMAQGYWQQQPGDPALYPAVPIESGHRGDLATYVHYAGALPELPLDQPFAGWDAPASRGWCAQLLWQALDSYFGQDRVP